MSEMWYLKRSALVSVKVDVARVLPIIIYVENSLASLSIKEY